MDASASPEVDAVNNNVYTLFLKTDSPEMIRPFKQKNPAIKYTKLPEFDFDSKVSWPRQSYTLSPRLRRIITLEEPETRSSRSLKSIESLVQPKPAATNISKRKIVTISEIDENDLHPKFSKDSKKSSAVSTNRSIGTENLREGKQMSQRTTSRLTTSAKCIKETKPGAKLNNVLDGKEVTSRSNYKSKLSNVNRMSIENVRSRNVKENEIVGNTKSLALSRTRVSKNLIIPSKSEKEISLIKPNISETVKSTTSTKKPVERRSKSKSPPPILKNKTSYLLGTHNQHKSIPLVIRVPHDRNVVETEIPTGSAKPTIVVNTMSNGNIDTEIVLHKDVNTETAPLPTRVDNVTDMNGFEPEIIYKCVESTDVQTDVIEETYDKLDIPNVSLKKDKSERKDKLLDLQSTSLPNLQIPPLKITDNRHEKSFLDAHYCKSTSYIISRSTLTYRTKQKINFHVVGSNDNAYSNQSPSPLAYPINVVSVFKEEMRTKDISNDVSMEETHESKSSKVYKNCINEIKSVDCSYVPNSNKLMKPSDIISTIRVNNSLLQNVYMCEQFKRELNFIDSFFESLQYLESCSLSEKCLNNDQIDQLVYNPAILDSEITAKNSEYDSLLSKLENGANSDDSETMTSKNLFLLNILIRDEQRRAKNLLCVLKRREDALKDFTKSQILYLENKKKQDNTDISALKKKQRGALLKLQHECGEMQRMRKALLTLSEKRKVALMKTKKDLELKLKTNVDVEQIILERRKLKRNTAVDRTSVPVKCFDLSSSGCEDSTTSRTTSESAASPPAAPAALELATSLEKSIQTGESIYETASINQTTDTAAENFVTVDGGYLNILFHNLSLPQIFNGGKQYEVNEEALRNIVDSTTSNNNVESWSEVIDKLMDQAQNGNLDKSSTPSTARSLVEEFEQYYRSLGEDEKSSDNEYTPSHVYKTSDMTIQVSSAIKPCEKENKTSTSTMTIDATDHAEDSVKLTIILEACDDDIKEEPTESVTSLLPTGPLPVPAGAADIVDKPVPEAPFWPSPKSSNSSHSESSTSSSVVYEPATSVASLAPSHSEAEELRRQQLAIEREIKELEQQQCRLLVVREIPDKPPPPYTPPSEARTPKPPRLFMPDEDTDDRIRKYLANPKADIYDPMESFEVLLKDFCHEAMERHCHEQGDKPWDACNLLPHKPSHDSEKLVETVTKDLTEVLTAATSSVVSGVGSRRSDHIDDILFAEWRRVEPEWTSLHSDEALVKNQLFETIFQRILTETVDEYKRTVLSPEPD